MAFVSPQSEFPLRFSGKTRRTARPRTPAMAPITAPGAGDGAHHGPGRRRWRPSRPWTPAMAPITRPRAPAMAPITRPRAPVMVPIARSRARSNPSLSNLDRPPYGPTIPVTSLNVSRFISIRVIIEDLRLKLRRLVLS
ncbi:hypothetical protein Rs2_03239 [Raphanus sativus]|nr:hypothetical protein Rs2_03239 [Raphanus sativus]